MNPNHPAKPTSQQVPGVEPLSAELAAECIDEVQSFEIRYMGSHPFVKALQAIASGHHVVISATELSALRAREERLRELAAELRLHESWFFADKLESILNEGKT